MIILASNSPRRKDILSEFGYEFSILKSNYEETCESADPIETALRFAKGKAESVFDAVKNKNDVTVIGADTVVYYNNDILGKPKDAADAARTLKKLSGNIHKVVTAYAIICEKGRVFGYDVSEVTFNDLKDELISAYVATGKPMDKAGSYGIQDGYNLVASVKGSVYNVIGFPIEKVKPVLDLLLWNKVDKIL